MYEMHFFVKAIQTWRSNLVRTDISGITFINPPSNYNEIYPVSDLSICIVRLQPWASKSRGPLATVSNIVGTVIGISYICYHSALKSMNNLYSAYFLIHSAVFLQSWGWKWGGESQLDSPRVFLYQNPARGVSFKQ